MMKPVSNFQDFIKGWEDIEREHGELEEFELDDREMVTLFLINKMMRSDKVFAAFMVAAVEIFSTAHAVGLRTLKTVLEIMFSLAKRLETELEKHRGEVH